MRSEAQAPHQGTPRKDALSSRQKLATGWLCMARKDGGPPPHPADGLCGHHSSEDHPRMFRKSESLATSGMRVCKHIMEKVRRAAALWAGL